ncbi:MAG: tetratricopeptide repeat protein [Planctomycetes bacterium]|nr:tetratricopeptide repeat protein [Planctomycetota bacterium]
MVDAGTTSEGRPTGLRPGWIAVALALVAVLVYSRTLAYGYVYDDSIIAQSPLADRPFALAEIFSNGLYGASSSDVALYRPLNDWTYLLTHAADRVLDPSGVRHVVGHAFNVLLHALATVLAFVWMLRCGLAPRVAAAAGLLFAVLPVHAESVANVTGRSDPLAVVFVLAMLLLHGSRWWALAPAAYLFALWSKESVLLLPLVAFACDAWIARRPLRACLARLAVDAAVAVVWVVLWRSAMRGPHIDPQPIENPLAALAHGARVVNALAIQWDYLARIVIPVGLSTDYSLATIPIVGATSPRCLGAVGGGLIAAAALVLCRRRAPLVSVSIAGYALAFAITSNLALPIGTIMAERLAYLPSLFLCVLVALPLAPRSLAPAFARAGFVVLVAAALVFALVTVRQCGVWKDELTLFTEQVRTAPDSAKAHMNLAVALARAGRPREALPHYDRSIAIYPLYGHAWYSKGNALYRSGASDAEAARCYAEAVRLSPRHQDAHANFALTLLRLGRVEDARVERERLAALNPEHPSLAVIDRRLASAGGAPR